ncbi:MAG: hypothetical protein MPK01_06855 [Gammaproteobacteria bacterium]|nr:hypothetical protein [Gammaproteobacteria bacterium]MDA7995972.1 hypothetical protein [Gammaproteobacteria bacterium]
MDTPGHAEFCEARFCRVWRRAAGADADAARALFAELAARYREPHRHYHTEAHIGECLARMDLASAESPPQDADAAELAVWFHDVVYEISACDNEAQSAEWFAAKADGCAPELRERVKRHILDTAHRAPPRDADAKLVVDVDLSGLGMDAEMFWRDGRNIRKESANLSDAEYTRRQGKFLRTLLERERIFSTAFFYERCEAAARRNINAALARYARGEW